MAYSKEAFNCFKCPGRGGDGGCPMWWETVHTNLSNNEMKIVKSCGFEQLPLYLTEVIKASNAPAAAIESTRNEMVKGLAQVAGVMVAALKATQAPSLPPSPAPEQLSAPVTPEERVCQS